MSLLFRPCFRLSTLRPFARVSYATHRHARFRLPVSPRSAHRPDLNSINPRTVFWGIITLNGLVYLMWTYSTSKYETFRDPSSLVWMYKNFLVNLNNIQQGRIWCLLTACFSHESTSHLLFNGLSFYFMAPHVIAILGNTSFLSLYLGAGVFASVASLAWRNLQGARPADSSHGASAAIYAIISFFACLQPRTTFLIFGVIPCPAWAWVAGIFCYDGYSAVSNIQTRIDSFGHISGLLAGAGYYFLRRSTFRL